MKGTRFNLRSLLLLILLIGSLGGLALTLLGIANRSDMKPLDRITERVNRHGDVNDPATMRPLLTLAEFFDGNETAGSIGCNLSPMPTPSEFHALLSRIAAQPDVAEVRVQITTFDDPEWPFSDTIWVITSANPATVATWFKENVRPDECWSGWTEGTVFEPCPVPPGMSPVACWWD